MRGVRNGEGMRINVTPHFTKDQARAYKLQCFLNAIAQEGKPLYSCLPFPISKAGRRMAGAMQDMDITDLHPLPDGWAEGVLRG